MSGIYRETRLEIKRRAIGRSQSTEPSTPNRLAEIGKAKPPRERKPKPDGISKPDDFHNDEIGF
jgi:hypothetical protein